MNLLENIYPGIPAFVYDGEEPRVQVSLTEFMKVMDSYRPIFLEEFKREMEESRQLAEYFQKRFPKAKPGEGRTMEIPLLVGARKP